MAPGQTRQLHHLLATDDAEESPCSIGSGPSQEQVPLVLNNPRSYAKHRRSPKVVIGVVIASATLLAVVGHFGTRLTSQSGTVSVETPDQTQFQVKAKDHTKKCHTAIKGEKCHKDVQWAMTMGIRDHPEWYQESCPRLQATGTFEEFQACVYRINKTSCPLPCNPQGGITKEMAHKIVHTAPKPEDAPKKPRSPCHIVKQGSCYDKILQVMTELYAKNPDAYPGITKQSTFEDIQTKLHEQDGSCPRPCSCETATQDSGGKCWGHIVWALKEGIKKHPTWYDELTMSSSFEEVQAYLHRDAKGTCKLPCSEVNWDNAKDQVGPKAVATCDEVAWPDKLNNQICGECKVVVDRMDVHYEKCGRFCQEIGRMCVGAWEEDSGCNPGKALTCDEKFNAPHGICQCGAMLPKEDLQKLAAAQPPPSAKETEAMHCHTANEGTKCFESVTYGMTMGLFENPQWYPGVDQFSSFEDFQKILHQNKDLKCPLPCKCHSAKKGEECYKNVQWVLKEGVYKHPEWYPGLNERSRWEDIQARLHEDNNSACGKPCSTKVWGSPSLFCIAVFRSEGYELSLVGAQVKKGVGIFGCDEFMVLSDKELDVTKVVKTELIPPCEEVGISKDGTAANTLIFMQVWQVVYEDVRYKAHDWIIKADPDAVVLPDRIRNHLKPHTGKNVWITNCMKYTGPGWPMMFGSLEAFSVQAMDTYYRGADTCRNDLEWQAWGEDLFMGNCLSTLGASSVFDGGLIGDEVCKGGDCGDGVTAAYHPFKDEIKWFECYNKAMGL